MLQLYQPKLITTRCRTRKTCYETAARALQTLPPTASLPPISRPRDQDQSLCPLNKTMRRTQCRRLVKCLEPMIGCARAEILPSKVRILTRPPSANPPPYHSPALSMRRRLLCRPRLTSCAVGKPRQAAKIFRSRPQATSEETGIQKVSAVQMNTWAAAMNYKSSNLR